MAWFLIVLILLVLMVLAGAETTRSRGRPNGWALASAIGFAGSGGRFGGRHAGGFARFGGAHGTVGGVRASASPISPMAVITVAITSLVGVIVSFIADTY